MRSGCKRIVNGILWGMSELITQERIAVGSSNLVEGLIAAPSQFSVYVYCGQTAGWMKTARATEVDLGPGNIVLDVVPAVYERGTAAPSVFAHVCCGQGRPS